MGLKGVHVALATCLVLGASAATAAAASPANRLEPLNQYVVSGGDPQVLAQQGFDLTEGAAHGAGGHGIVATPDQAADLRAKGFTVTAPFGEETKAAAAPPNPLADPSYGYDVYRPWGEQPAACPNTCSGAVDAAGHPINLKTWYEGQRAAHTDIVKRVVYGHSRYGQELVAYRVTIGAGSSADASKPVVFYDSTQHAREWIASETERRLFQYVLAHANDSSIRAILQNTELWFVPIMNPDGYDYTFQSKATRLWRKTLADNDGDNQITANDGVDPNRNWAAKWRYDKEGAQDIFSPDDYRGPSAESEPEVSSADALIARLKPKYLLDYHSYGPLILYPEGWQVSTEGTDAPAMKALAGTMAEPAIPGFYPEVSAQLYITNGDITDNAYFKYGTQAYTVELEGGSGPAVGGTQGDDSSYLPGGFVYQDSERDVQTEFTKNLAFALDLAKSAQDPSKPVSHLGNEAPDLVPHTFTQSYGDPQTVEVNARRALGAVRVNWRVNGGAQKSAPMTEYAGGTKYGTPGMYYHRLRAQVTGFQAGDSVRVWFSGGGAETDPFTFSAVAKTPGKVLVLAAEDYSGNSSVTGAGPRPGPEYLDYYRDALTRLNIPYDVYDIDSARKAADALGVLSHYKAVVWYTGNDLYVREPGEPGGTGNSKLMQDEVLAARDYLNDGGKLLVTGQNALQGSWDQFLYNPLGAPPNSYCKSNNASPNQGDDIPPGQSESCALVSNDFIQYYMGGWINIVAGSDHADIAALPFTGAGSPFGTTAFHVDGPGGADNQEGVSTFVPTSNILPADQFPQFKSATAVKFARPSAFDPTSGTQYAVAQSSDEGYQRLRRTIDLTAATTAHLKFKLSYDTENTFDYVFVEAHTVGQNDWTTLPDANGNTTNEVGASCDIDWDTIHPFIDHYQTNPTPATDCTNTGSTGAWNAATGNSGGFQDWDIDLSAYKGKQVEVSITYAQDFASSGLGVFLDDVQTVKNGAVTENQDFESGLGSWVAGPPPDGTANQAAWVARGSIGYTDGPGVATNQTELWGFGLEAVQGADKRAAVLGDALTYLLNTTVTIPGTTTEPEAQPNPVAQPQPQPVAAPVAPAASKPTAVSRPKLGKVTRGHARVYVRVACTSGVACSGTLKLKHGGKAVVSRSYSLKAGKSRTYTLKVAKRYLGRKLTLSLYRSTTVVASKKLTVR